MRELMRRGIEDVLKELHEALAGRPIYLCWDMDVFDPSCAPGVASPSWGGFSAREGIEFMRGLAGLDIVAFDVNTVSPPHDGDNMTAFVQLIPGPYRGPTCPKRQVRAKAQPRSAVRRLIPRAKPA